MCPGGSITDLGPGDAVSGDGDTKKSDQRVDLSRLLPEGVNEIVGRPGGQGSLGRYGLGRSSPPHPGQSMISMAMLGSLEPRPEPGSRECDGSLDSLWVDGTFSQKTPVPRCPLGVRQDTDSVKT